MSIYNYLVRKPNGEILSMETYRGKTMLIVNSASQCAFTYQFEDLQKMYTKYKDRGFVVLAFPTNQFDEQNPEDGLTTAKACKVNFGVEFPIFDLVEVNGERTEPLFNYIKHEVDVRKVDKSNMQEMLLMDNVQKNYPDYLIGRNIRWNFTKFLVDKSGKVTARFEPTDSMLDVEHAVETSLLS